MKTIMSQIKSREELEMSSTLTPQGSVKEVTVTEKYDWSYEVTIDKTSKARKSIDKNCDVCTQRKGRKICKSGDCSYILDFSKLAKSMYGYIVNSYCKAITIEHNFGKIRNRSLNKRVCQLVKNFDGKMFYNLEHELRYKRTIKSITRTNPRAKKKNLSAIFFLTATNNLWMKISKCVGDFEIDFDDISINNLTVDEYAMLQIAKMVYSSDKLVLTSESIKIDELIDEDIITDDIFKMYINGQLVKRHGLEVLTLDYLNNKSNNQIKE